MQPPWSQTSFFADATQLEVVGGQIGTASASTGNASGNSWTLGPFFDVVDVFADFPTMGANGLSVWLHIWQGLAANPTGYQFQLQKTSSVTTNVFLARVPSGTTLGSAAVAQNNGDSYGMRLDPTTKHLTLYQNPLGAGFNQTPLVDFDDSANMPHGPWFIALEVLGNTWRLTNFGGGSVPASTTRRMPLGS